MSEQFYTILTGIGKAKIANSGALGTKVNLVKFKVGDGGGTYYNPTEEQIDVKNKVWEGNISSTYVDENNSNWIVIETVIPTSAGGFTIREAGIFDDENNLIAIGKYPETYKPIAAEGSSKDLLIRMILEISNAENVNLKVDPTVILATKKDIQLLESKVQETNSQLNKKANETDNARTTTSKTVTGAINELNNNKANETDNARTTTSKTVTGAINQLNSNKANKDGTLQTNLNSDMLDGKHENAFCRTLNYENIDINDPSYPVPYMVDVNANSSAPSTDWWHISYIPHRNYPAGYGAQIAIAFHGGNATYVRSAGGKTWGAWKQVITQDGGSFTGIVRALSNASHTTSQMRNICLSPNDANLGLMGNGDIWIKYS